MGGNDLSERGFAGAGWTVENQRLDAVGFNGTTEQFPWADDVSLAGKFVEVAWPHPGGERLVFGVCTRFWEQRDGVVALTHAKKAAIFRPI